MLDKVISIISEYQDIPADTIHADSHLVNDLGFTSYDVVSLVGKFEDEFDIDSPPTGGGYRLRHSRNIIVVNTPVALRKSAAKHLDFLFCTSLYFQIIGV